MTLPETYTSAGSERIRRFVVETGEPLAPPGSHRFASPEDAADTPVAAAVLSVPGIQEIIIEANTVTALRRDGFSWDELQDRVRYAIGTALQSGPAAAAAASALDDDETFEVVDRILRRDINPAVASHGGQVDLIDVQDGVVVLRMMGGCQGCGMANVTLRQGIEAQLRRVIPNLKGIQDITDHTAGTNPYFR